MKAIKRGIILIVLLIILSLSVFSLGFSSRSGLYLNLTRTKISPNQNFDGFVNISFKDPIPVDAKLKFFVNSRENKNVTYSMEWLFRNVNDKEIISQRYDRSGAPVDSKDIFFNSPSSKIEAGIDMTSTTVADIEDITEFNMTFLGSSVDNSFPNLKVDIGNDGSIDYQFQGEILTNQFDSIPSPYLSSDTPSQTKEVGGQQQDVYCEKVFIDKPSKSYRISANVKRLVTGASLHAAITQDPNIVDCDQTEKCCTLHPGSTMNKFNCIVNTEINDQGDFYVCLTALGGDQNDYSKAYYELGVDTDSSNVAGYYNGNPSSIDYFLSLEAQKYNNQLSSSIKHNFDTQILKDYLTSCGNPCLLIPINITSNSRGKITLSGLNVKYTDSNGRGSRVTRFTPLNYLPKSINYTGKSLLINLNYLENLTSNFISNNNNLFAKMVINNQEINSNLISYDVVEGPLAFINYNTGAPALNELVSFSGNRSVQVGNKRLVDFYWDFGDNNFSNGTFVQHSFINPGNYTVRLTVVDSDGLNGKDKVLIQVGQSNAEPRREVNNAFSLLQFSKNYLASSSSQVKDTAVILGISSRLTALESNLTSKNNSITNILNSDQSQSDKDSKLNVINQDLLQLEKSIPSSLSVGVVTFNAKISNINQIPSEVSDKKSSVFKAQEGVIISGEARGVNIKYNDHTENFILVKKKITQGSGVIYEVVPSGGEINILTTGAVKVSDNVYKFNQNEFLYTFNGDIQDALSTVTIIVPSNLPPVNEVQNNQEPVNSNIKVKQEISPYLIGGVTLVVIILIVYFALFFRGGIMNNYSRKKLFKSERDYQSLVGFANDALRKGVKEERIIEALKKKGWTDQQVSVVFQQVHKLQKKFKK